MAGVLSPMSLEGTPRGHLWFRQVILPFRQFTVSQDTPNSAQALALFPASEKFSWCGGNGCMSSL